MMLHWIWQFTSYVDFSVEALRGGLKLNETKMIMALALGFIQEYTFQIVLTLHL